MIHHFTLMVSVDCIVHISIWMTPVWIIQILIGLAIIYFTLPYDLRWVGESFTILSINKAREYTDVIAAVYSSVVRKWQHCIMKEREKI